MSISSAVPTPPPQSPCMQPLLTGRRTGGGEAVKEGVEGEVRGTQHLLSTTAVFTVDVTISLPTRLDSNCVSEWVKNMGKKRYCNIGRKAW